MLLKYPAVCFWPHPICFILSRILTFSSTESASFLHGAGHMVQAFRLPCFPVAMSGFLGFCLVLAICRASNKGQNCVGKLSLWGSVATLSLFTTTMLMYNPPKTVYICIYTEYALTPYGWPSFQPKLHTFSKYTFRLTYIKTALTVLRCTGDLDCGSQRGGYSGN